MKRTKCRWLCMPTCASAMTTRFGQAVDKVRRQGGSLTQPLIPVYQHAPHTFDSTQIAHLVTQDLQGQ
jgi:hypothetical protein